MTSRRGRNACRRVAIAMATCHDPTDSRTYPTRSIGPCRPGWMQRGWSGCTGDWTDRAGPSGLTPSGWHRGTAQLSLDGSRAGRAPRTSGTGLLLFILINTCPLPARHRTSHRWARSLPVLGLSLDVLDGRIAPCSRAASSVAHGSVAVWHQPAV
jgi:hypothetical protein